MAKKLFNIGDLVGLAFFNLTVLFKQGGSIVENAPVKPPDPLAFHLHEGDLLGLSFSVGRLRNKLVVVIVRVALEDKSKFIYVIVEAELSLFYLGLRDLLHIVVIKGGAGLSLV